MSTDTFSELMAEIQSLRDEHKALAESRQYQIDELSDKVKRVEAAARCRTFTNLWSQLLSHKLKRRTG